MGKISSFGPTNFDVHIVRVNKPCALVFPQMGKISYFGTINFVDIVQVNKPCALVVPQMRKISFFGAINFRHPVDGSKYTFVADRISDLFTLLGTLVHQQLLYGPSPHPPLLSLMLLVLFVLVVRLIGRMEI